MFLQMTSLNHACVVSVSVPYVAALCMVNMHGILALAFLANQSFSDGHL